MNQEKLALLRILQGAKLQKRLPRFLSEQLCLYLDATGQTIDEALENLKQ